MAQKQTATKARTATKPRKKAAPKKAATKKPTGRPPIAREQFDAKRFEMLCTVQATRAECSAHLGMSHDTLGRCIARHYGKHATFASVYAQFAPKGTLSLRRVIWQRALAGDRDLLKHLSKQYLEMKDVVEYRADDAQLSRVLDHQQVVARDGIARDSERVNAVLALLGAAAR